MDFGLSPEQRMLRDAVDRLLREHCPLDHVREVAEGGHAVSAAVVAALSSLAFPASWCSRSTAASAWACSMP